MERSEELSLSLDERGVPVPKVDPHPEPEPAPQDTAPKPKPAPVAPPAAPPAGPASGPKSYDTLKSDGDKYTGNLNNAIAQHSPDAPPKGDIDTIYEVVRDTQQKAGPDLNPIPQVSDTRALVYSQYSISNKGDKSNSNPITRVMVSRDQGVIINDISYADKDTTQPASSKVKWSDQAFQAWTKEGGNQPLKSVIQRSVVNPDTNNAMVKAHTDAKLGPKAVGHWLPGSDAYKALLGTDNGRPTVNMLQFHHNALGNLKVTSIDTYPLLGGRSKAIMVLNLGQ